MEEVSSGKPEQARPRTAPAEKSKDDLDTQLVTVKKKLLGLSRERDEVEAAYNKLPPSGGRTESSRRRKRELEQRLDSLQSRIAHERLHVKRLELLRDQRGFRF